MELLHYDRLSVDARCRRTSSERHHVDDDYSSFVRLKWSWRGRGHGLRRRSALPQEMARQDRAATRAMPVCGLLHTEFSGQALPESIS